MNFFRKIFPAYKPTPKNEQASQDMIQGKLYADEGAAQAIIHTTSAGLYRVPRPLVNGERRAQWANKYYCITF